MLPDLRHLQGLSPIDFEAERCRIIGDFLATLPPDRRSKVYLYQMRIDEARDRLSPDDFLRWMQAEARELADNMSDLFLAVAHQAQDLTKDP